MVKDVAPHLEDPSEDYGHYADLEVKVQQEFSLAEDNVLKVAV